MCSCVRGSDIAILGKADLSRISHRVTCALSSERQDAKDGRPPQVSPRAVERAYGSALREKHAATKE
jgi:hypothetical protein